MGNDPTSMSLQSGQSLIRPLLPALARGLSSGGTYLGGLARDAVRSDQSNCLQRCLCPARFLFNLAAPPFLELSLAILTILPLPWLLLGSGHQRPDFETRVTSSQMQHRNDICVVKKKKKENSTDEDNFVEMP